MAEINFAESLFNPWFREFPKFFMTPFSAQMISTDSIKMDVREQPDMYLVEAEMSGVQKGSLKVSVDGNRITVEGDIRNGVGLPKEERLIFGERHVGHVERTLQLDSPLDPSRSTAHYEDGLLTVLLYKQSAGGATQITVS